MDEDLARTLAIAGPQDCGLAISGDQSARAPLGSGAPLPNHLGGYALIVPPYRPGPRHH